ncbi:hypothetical protein [Cellulomonas sp.]|uniref:hypothetical protein n=1 Tax=Cellulomonas sp. TaxID=40001 RepID=UPI002811D501|nr:hypothetical protein [Cellulomonas sp.]
MSAAGRARRSADLARRAWAALRGTRAVRAASVPHVEVATGRTVPALVLRVALGLVAVGLLAVALGSADVTGAALPPAVLVVAAATPAVWPRSVAAGLLVLVVGGSVLVAGPPGAGRLALLVLLLHALLWFTAVAARTGRRTRVELAVLRDAAPPALVAQAGAQLLALGAAALAGGVGGGDVWRVVGVVAAVLVAAVVLVRPEEPWWREALGEG